MENFRKLLIAFLLFTTLSTFAQLQVTIDNWYNREVHSKTGLPFHYLWSDTQNSGFSELGNLFFSKGAQLNTLENAPNAKNIADADIYIIVDPDTTSENPSPNYVQSKDIKAVKKWVKKGGVLLLLANDRPNCEFTHFNKLAGEFGIRFNAVSINPVKDRKWDMGAETNLPDHPVFKGVNKIYLKEVASIEISGSTKGVLLDDGNILMAECSYGKGFVFAVGDPWLYNEYIGHIMLPSDFENEKAAENLVSFLIHKAKSLTTKCTKDFTKDTKNL